MLKVVSRFKSEKVTWEPGQNYTGSNGDALLAQGLLVQVPDEAETPVDSDDSDDSGEDQDGDDSDDGDEFADDAGSEEDDVLPGEEGSEAVDEDQPEAVDPQQGQSKKKKKKKKKNR